MADQIRPHEGADVAAGSLAPRRGDPHGPAFDDPIVELSTAAKAAITAVLVVIALVSAVFVANVMSRPEAHATSIESLDRKAETVTSLAAGSTAAAGVLSLLPGDAGTPIAEKLVDLSSDFLIVMAAIYLEKYLLTIFGLAAFRILIPLGLLFLIGGVWVRARWTEALRGLGLRLLFVGVAVAFVVPASIWVSNMVESTYAADLEHAEAVAAEIANVDAEELEALEAEAADGQETATTETSEPTGFLGALVGWATDAGETVAETVTNAVGTVSSGAAELVDAARNTLNDMIEALAVLIVTNCVIPILVLLFFLWLVNTILGTSFSLPMRGPRPHGMGHRA